MLHTFVPSHADIDFDFADPITIKRAAGKGRAVELYGEVGEYTIRRERRDGGCIGVPQSYATLDAALAAFAETCAEMGIKP